MKEYFILQYKMTIRKLKDFGIHPIIAFCLLLIGFSGLSIYLFLKTEFAEYVFMLVGLSFASGLSEIKRNDFLKYCFGTKKYLKVRLIENFLVVFPFIAFLAYKQLFTSVFILALLSLLLALINFRSSINFTLPTPFSKKPYEFIVGFRNTFFLFPFVYFLTFMSVFVNNLNLGIFSMLLVFIISIFFYSKPENEYYVWSYSLSPRKFLLKKIMTGLHNVSLLNIPIFLALGIFFFNEIQLIFIFMVLGYIYLITIIVAKYSAYHYEMNLPQGLLIGISLLFPPMLLGIIPFFYYQSNKRLNDILE